MKRAVVVQIAGQRIAVRSDAAESYVRALAQLVEGRLKAVGQSGVQAVSFPHAVLAAMSIADDLMRERGERMAFRKKVRDRSKRILDLLDREIGPHPAAEMTTE